MQFQLHPAALPDNAPARLYLSTGTPSTPAAALYAGLTDSEPFAAARIPANGSFTDIAVLRLGNTERDTLAKAFRHATAWAQKQPSLALDLSAFPAAELPAALTALTTALGEAAYRFDRFKKTAKPAALQQADFYAPAADEAARTALEQAQALLHGINLCKDLGNTAGNICTPAYLADTARAEAQAAGAAAKILGADYIREHMGSFWSVAKGSAQEPRLIELSYFGAPDKNAAPVVLVGKGVTFDSGGISLKPGAEMDEMKFDMCGGASVIGTFIAAARAKLPLNLIAIVPACENMPDAAANKPGDIVTAMDGTTIEILNTDAEGRLILCDALTYAAQFKPAALIDVATLTGACVIALGHVASGLVANNQALADSLLAAARQSGDKTWQLPLFEEYGEQLQSNFADLQNIGGRPAGTLTAAAFLAHFAKEQTWAHLDIAGTAWKSGKEKGATGRPVPLLWQYLCNLARA
ncbi:leucyl aminopeptidase [Eikenella sp. Marseille-P7795]|uniref:leucyl aminopeptidase n=1 Tax=Eikenella sp. Marseille-P7795 TaxID=2866577 RepID=UPI001CE3DB39|nr:leucyl aminopeptidase [Eikenella sp. Marseille-P7795]